MVCMSQWNLVMALNHPKAIRSVKRVKINVTRLTLKLFRLKKTFALHALGNALGSLTPTVLLHLQRPFGILRGNQAFHCFEELDMNHRHLM